MLADGEFDIRTDEAGIEVWITQMGDFMNMNTAWIDRENGVVAITDPFDSQRWVEALAHEGLRPTHILYTYPQRSYFGVCENEGVSSRCGSLGAS